MMNIFSTRYWADLYNRRKKDPRSGWLFRWFRIAFISVIIALTLFFGFLLFRYTISTHITGFLFIFWTGLILWYGGKKIVKWLKIPPPHPRRLKKALKIIIISWLCIESLLRMMGGGRIYNEKIGFYYTSGFVQDAEMNKDHRRLHVHPAYFTYTEKRKEFAYETRSNKEGLRDIDYPFNKEENEYRIICLGNSFTEGIGAPQDSTWPILLGDILNRHANRKITVMNAGVSGSDIFFEYALLKEKMLAYHPDLVLLGLGSTDLEMYRFRGGFERFTPDGIRFRKGPSWEKLYAVSFITRFIVKRGLKYKDHFMPPAEFKLDSIKALNEAENCIREFQKLSKKERFDLALVFVDDRQVRYASTIKKFKAENTTPVIDLFEYAKKVENIDEKKHKAYYWPSDGHCNPRGYALFARGVEWNLRKLGIIDSLMKN